MELCGAKHPDIDPVRNERGAIAVPGQTIDVLCGMPVGANAIIPAVTEPELNADGFQVGERTVELERRVHVHGGFDLAIPPNQYIWESE